MRRRTDDEALQTVANDEEQRREHESRQVRIDPKKPLGEERRKHCGGEQRAVREVDDVQHAVDQRQPQRDECVDRAGHEAIEDGGNQEDRRQHRRTE
jgi:hypothetical protein